MATATPIAGAVPITQFTAAQQAQLRSGAVVGNYQVLDGHVMDLRSSTGQALLAQRAANIATVSAPAPGAWAAGPDPITNVTSPVFSPAPPKGAWMNPPDYFQGRTTYPDGSSIAGNQTGTGSTVPQDDSKLAAQRDALALIRTTLAQYGLPDSLADWAWSEIVAGKGNAEIMLDLRQRPEFKTEFPEIDARTQKGLAPLSPAEIIAYRQQARQIMSAAGLPSGFYDSKDDFTNFLANDVSINELNDRVNLAKQATYQIPPEVASRLQSEFGITPGSGPLTAYFLDDKKALPLLQRDFAAAGVGGAADRAGYAGISNDQARSLVDQGITDTQAQQGFNDLQLKQQLMYALPGSGEDNIDQQTQLGAEFGGNANAQRRIEDRQRRRIAEFQGGGDFTQTQGGVVGLGRATS
jgi:hypothetical protein